MYACVCLPICRCLVMPLPKNAECRRSVSHFSFPSYLYDAPCCKYAHCRKGKIRKSKNLPLICRPNVENMWYLELGGWLRQSFTSRVISKKVRQVYIGCCNTVIKFLYRWREFVWGDWLFFVENVWRRPRGHRWPTEDGATNGLENSYTLGGLSVDVDAGDWFNFNATE